MAIPDKKAITRTYIFTLLFCLPFAGTEELFAFMLIGQLIFSLMVFLSMRKDMPGIMGNVRKSHPTTFFLFLAWLAAMGISYSILFFTSKNGWMTLAATLRQLFIFIQIAFCLSLMRCITVSGRPATNILLPLGFGLIGMIFIHFAVLCWYPRHIFTEWTVNPLLSPNMRDIGDITSAAICIFGAMYWVNRQNQHSILFLILFTISWAYLLWTGGRASIAFTLLTNILMMALATAYNDMPKQKIAITVIALLAAYLLCLQFSIYEWNGLIRYSSEFHEKNFSGDPSNGRLATWIWSLQAWLQKPWFGLGPFSFYFIPERFNHQFYHDHPHNLVIQSLIEWGIVGTVLFLALLLSLAFIGLKQIKPRLAAGDAGFLASGGIILTLSASSMVSGSYWDYQPVMTLVTAFAGFPLLHELAANKHLTIQTPP